MKLVSFCLGFEQRFSTAPGVHGFCGAQQQGQLEARLSNGALLSQTVKPNFFLSLPFPLF